MYAPTKTKSGENRKAGRRSRYGYAVAVRGCGSVEDRKIKRMASQSKSIYLPPLWLTYRLIFAQTRSDLINTKKRIRSGKFLIFTLGRVRIRTSEWRRGGGLRLRTRGGMAHTANSRCNNLLSKLGENETIYNCTPLSFIGVETGTHHAMVLVPSFDYCQRLSHPLEPKQLASF